MSLTPRQLQDLRLRGIGPQIVQQVLSIHYLLADVQEIERHEVAMLMEQVLVSDRPLVMLRAMAEVGGVNLSPILQQVAAQSASNTVQVEALANSPIAKPAPSSSVVVELPSPPAAREPSTEPEQASTPRH